MQLLTTRTTTIVTTTAVVLMLAAASIFALLVLFKTTNAGASAVSGFKAGRIIDDAVFYNANSMSANQVQTFLNSKVTCDTNGTGRATDWGRGDITRATLASYIRNGTNGYENKRDTKFHAPPYTCLKDFKQDTPQIAPASGLCSGVPAQKSRTAAQIIVDISKACGINPQVLLVLLEKEQSLVTDIWPLKHQFNRATGFACPDNVGGACDPKYNGFYSQVYSAARQFKVYKARPNDYNYVAGRSNNLLWQVAPKGIATFVNNSGSPNNRRSGHCGHSQVHIENQATAALYIYTPYQPNSTALRNYPGTGDACSAYGNRNFYGLFTSWFGSTSDPLTYRHEKLLSTSNSVIKSSDVKVGNSMETLTIKNKIYVFYHDSQNKTLRYSHYNGSSWSDHLLDGAGSKIQGSLGHDVGAHVIKAFERNGRPQVFYRSSTGRSLRHAWIDNNQQWRTETLDGSILSVSGTNENIGTSIEGFTRGSSGIQLYYHNQDSQSLKHAWFDGSRWRFETLDGTTDSVSGKNSKIGPQIKGFNFNSSGIQLYYHNQDSKSLKHAWFDGSRWRFETLDGTTDSVLKNIGNTGSSLAAAPYNNGIQLFYYDSTAGELRHAWWRSGQGWKSERMDGSENSVLKNAINSGAHINMQVHKNTLFVAYFDDGAQFNRSSAWRLTYWGGSNWNQVILDGTENSVSRSPISVPKSTLSMASYSNGSLQVFHRLNDGSMRHTWVR